MSVGVYVRLSESHRSLWAYSCLFTNFCSVKEVYTHIQSNRAHTDTGNSLHNLIIKYETRAGTVDTHTQGLVLIMAVSSIFSLSLIIWSVGHRPCRFHGSLLLIKINSIQLHIGAAASYYIIEFGLIMRAAQSPSTCDLLGRRAGD